VKTREILEFSQIEPFIEEIVWSPDSQYIAAHISIQEDMASDQEDHIYIFNIKDGTSRPLIQK
jgi:hypothetical protein